jgi:D-sedoheptulose 7-phosphate isomerase
MCGENATVGFDFENEWAQIQGHLSESAITLQQLVVGSAVLAELSKVKAPCVNAFRDQRKILIAGNDGSAADAQHFAGRLVRRFYFD